MQIKRSEWSRAVNNGHCEREYLNNPICMLNSTGGLCCLGHKGRQIDGFTDSQMFALANPQEVRQALKTEGPTDLTAFESAAIELNDLFLKHIELMPAQQEAELIKLFAAEGIELSFVD